MHVKYENNRSITTMGTVCNDPHKGRNRNKTKGVRTTLSFGGFIHATAVATLVKDRALDPKVQGSNPGGLQWVITTIKTDRIGHLEGNYVKGLNLTPLFYNE